jgi:hypothetical protein
MNLWRITARTTSSYKGADGFTWRTGHDFPSFCLDGDVSGIVSADHAARIAADLLRPRDGERLLLGIFTPDDGTAFLTFEDGRITDGWAL